MRMRSYLIADKASGANRRLIDPHLQCRAFCSQFVKTKHFSGIHSSNCLQILIAHKIKICHKL